MTSVQPIRRISISGFRSIVDLQDLPLGEINVLIGANGVGKTNFISFFRMLHWLREQRLQIWIGQQGGADRILSFGIKYTNAIRADIDFGLNRYTFSLQPTVGTDMIFSEEKLFFDGPRYGPQEVQLGAGHQESRLKEQSGSIGKYIYTSMAGWKFYHFHDTGDTALVKRHGPLHDHAYLRPDARNLAAFLYRLRSAFPDSYELIRKTVALSVPFFDDFILNPTEQPSGESSVGLLWRQKDSDYPFWPSQLSDGSLRFICLATALLQPEAPSTIIIDEPELGLHPHALVLLGSLIRSASKRMQIIIATQSVPLLNQFSPQDVIVVSSKEGRSEFSRLDESDLEAWLQDYTLGELWEKNVLGGRPGS